MIEFKRSKKSRSQNALFNPYKNGISKYDMAFLSSKEDYLNNKYNNPKTNSKRKHFAA